jgi:hypothetical protein
MKRLIYALIGLVMIVSIGLIFLGANSTSPGVKHITITGLDEDWVLADAGLTSDIDLWAIVFYPSATDDQMIIHDDGIDGDEIFDSGLCADKYDRIVLYFPPRFFVSPVIDITDCTLTTAANAKVKIYYR